MGTFSTAQIRLRPNKSGTYLRIWADSCWNFGLKQQGFRLDASHGGDLVRPVPVSVLGLPFEDFEHPQQRGTPQVATLWEIHPAIINFL